MSACTTAAGALAIDEALRLLSRLHREMETRGDSRYRGCARLLLLCRGCEKECPRRR